jgi:hypothetical protein
MKKIYLWVSGKGWTPFQYNELSELAAEFEARNIKLGDECKLGAGCKLGDGCELGYGCDVPKSLFISASRQAVSYWGEDVIKIGCKCYTISEWQKHFRKIGEAEGYSTEQMEEYKGYIDLIATMHKTWALH